MTDCDFKIVLRQAQGEFIVFAEFQAIEMGNSVKELNPMIRGRKKHPSELAKYLIRPKKNTCNQGKVTVVFLIASTKVDVVIGARLVFGFSRA